LTITDEPVPSYADQVRRIDVELRSRFPHLLTRLYEVDLLSYVIVFDAELQDAQKIAKEFDGQIRWVTVPVRISNDTPPTYRRQLTPIQDTELARDFAGMSLTTFAFENLVAARFPELVVIGSRLVSGTTQTIELLIGCGTDAELKQRVLAFCQALGLPCVFSLVEEAGPAKSASIPLVMDPLKVVATGFRGQLPAYVREDEDLWFDRLDGVYAGGVTSEDLLGGAEASRCFLDFQIGRQVNIRQALLLYDVVYCALPLAPDHGRFLNEQSISDEDLVVMAQRRRLRLVSVQPEERLRLPLLERLAETAPGSILGRRRTALVLLADLVRTAGEYRLNDSRLMKSLSEVCADLESELGLPARELLGWILWPISALRSSLHTIHERASNGFPAIGVAGLIAKAARNHPKGTDLEFLSYALSERVQIGHALRATVLPGLDDIDSFLTVMKLQGDLLNFYRAFNTRYAAAWIGEQRRKQIQGITMPAMPLFEFPSDVPIDEFLDAVSLPSTQDKGRALMDRLALVSPEARVEEVAKLDRDLRRKQARENGHLLNFESADEAWSILSAVTGIVAFPPVLAARSWAKRIREIARKNRNFDRFIQAIEADIANSLGTTQDLDFLSRIDRVARLRRPTIH